MRKYFSKQQFFASAAAILLSVFAVAVVTYGASVVDTASVGSGTSTPGAAVGAKGAGIFEGFVHAGSFRSTSTDTSWIMGGNLGLGTTTPGVKLDVRGAGLFDGFVSADYFTSTSTNPSWLMGRVGIGTTTPGAGLGVKGAAIAEGFVSADYFKSTSTADSWVLGGLGLGTTTVSDTLNRDGSLAVEGVALIGDYVYTSRLTATSTTATSTISYGGFEANHGTATPAFIVDGTSGTVGVGTSTVVSESSDFVNLNVGYGTGSTTVFVAGGATVGGGLIIKDYDGNGCTMITVVDGGLSTGDVVCPE